MNILEQILKAQGGAQVREMAGQLGLGEAETRKGMESLLPALTGALQKNVAQPSGSEQLFNALRDGNHSRYIEQAGAMRNPETITDGNKILGHLLGGKDVSRQVAQQAAQKSGLQEGVLKKMLPMLATMAMGSMAKQTKSQGISGSGALGGMLGSFLGGGKSGGIGGAIGKLFG